MVGELGIGVEAGKRPKHSPTTLTPTIPISHKAHGQETSHSEYKSQQEHRAKAGDQVMSKYQYLGLDDERVAGYHQARVEHQLPFAPASVFMPTI